VSKPKVLLFDLETSPIIAHVWGLFDQNVALNQIKSDWHLLSWSAKWLGDAPNKIMYMDQRGRKDLGNDKEILKGLWKLLDEADVVITQNGKSFDSKKVNARFILNGLNPPSPYRHIDTLRIAKKNFGFTSNKLEYMSHKLCTKYKKLKTAKFQGFDLWKACLEDNLSAWKEMEKYNKHDVLALEELYNKLQAWDKTVNFNVYSDTTDFVCNCGSKKLQKNGFRTTNSGQYQRYRCLGCGAAYSNKANLLPKAKKKSIISRDGSL